MSEAAGRAVRFREVLANPRAEKCKVETTLHEGKARVGLELYKMDKLPTLRRRGLSAYAMTITEAKRLHAVLAVAIEAAEAARTGHLFDADKALRERAGEVVDGRRAEA